ncbi:MAG TPA: hypothetical protein PLV47_07825 [Flavobacterium sp.]|nr:hypothetical protein [Flavobacterium sp.]
MKMKIRSLADIPAALFYPLKEWTESSITNFNLFIGIITIFLFVSIFFVVVFSMKIGKSDERSSMINLKSMYCALVILITCDIFLPNTYLVNQFLIIKYGLASLGAGFYLMLQYRKDTR